MAVEKETQLEVWLEENMPEPVGGNPNYVETITGTLAEPWGNVNYASLIDGINDGSITAEIIASIPNGPSLDFALRVSSDNAALRGSGAFYNVSDTVTLNEAFAVSWYPNATLGYAVITQGGVDMNITEYAALAITTLTIIHHPLPEE